MKKIWPLISILFAGLLLRLYHLTSLSLWHDEAFSALLIRYSWTEMIRRIALDVHPPAYYIALRFWHYIFGGSLISLRGFSLFFSLGVIVAVYLLVKEAFKSEKLALLAALFIALNPFQIQFVSQARMYTMGAFFAIFAAYFLIRAIKAQRSYTKNPAVYFYLLFAICSAVSILTHYYLLFAIAAICFYGLIMSILEYKMSFNKYKWLFISYLLIALAFLPWLKVFLFQYKQVGSGYWIPPMDRWSIPATFWQMLTGINLDPSKSSNQILFGLATIFSVFFLYKFLKKVKAQEKWLIILLLLAPFGGAIAFLLLARLKGETSSVYLLRYFIFATSFYSIALAAWFENFRPRNWAKFLLILYCTLNIYGVYSHWKKIDVYSKPGMSGAAKYLDASASSKDKIFVASSSQFFSFKYYNRTPVSAKLYTPGLTSVSDLPHYFGTAILNDADLAPDLKQGTHNGDTVWMLWTNGFYGAKPNAPANWTQISENSYGEINFYTPPYTIYVTKYKVN